MDGFGRPYAGGERRSEVVSGKAAPPVYRGEKAWGFGDGEMKRKKRIAKYKVYTVEGRVKAGFKRGLRWLKTKCSEIIHGY